MMGARAFLPLDGDRELRVHRDVRLTERAFAGPAYRDDDLVFCDQPSNDIYPSRLTEWFGQHRDSAAFRTGTLRTLRHTAATLALSSGVPVHIVAARFGDDARTVLTTYAHLLPQSDELAADRIAAALAS
jgi:integrase